MDLIKTSDAALQELQFTLLGSLLHFTRFFYKLRTKREFYIPEPPGRQNHYFIISEALSKTVEWTEEEQLIVLNCPPRYGKTEMLIHYIAWTLARYPDSQYIYACMSAKLAKIQTQTIRDIISMPEYQLLFNVKLSKSSKAKELFHTTDGGMVLGVGAQGTITGLGGGITGVNRFGGAIIIDDIHKPDEVLSDTIREGVKTWYKNTLSNRYNSPYTPIIASGQRTNEDDLYENLSKQFDGRPWKTINIPVLDAALNPLDPRRHTRETLLSMQEHMPYEFAAQFMGNPMPAGGALFKQSWWLLLEEEPKILGTFITVDTAETDKTFNDATAMSFWGIYEANDFGGEKVYALHWLDCMEVWVEPADLEQTLYNFYTNCMRHPVKPRTIAIEKKSTGTYLCSVIKNIQGIHIREIERASNAGSKSSRFIKIQPYISRKLVTLPDDGKHTKLVMDHMNKITANNSHRFDDIADTVVDAIQLALIDKSISFDQNSIKTEQVVVSMSRDFNNRINQLGANTWRR